MKDSSISYKKITQSFSAYLLLLKNHKVASQFLFKMVESGFEKYDEYDPDMDYLKSFILDIVYEISMLDSEYADRMADEYFKLI